MRSLIFFILIFFSSMMLHAQDTINRKDADGKKQGYWIKLDSNGKKIYEGRFTHDIPCGEFRYYYPDGQLKAVSILSDGGKRSLTTTYYRNGRKMAEGKYLNEKKDSLWKFYSQYEAVIVSEENYHQGKKEGISKTFYADGVIAEKMTWKAGVRNGPWEQYYTDGKLKLQCAYLDDQKDGFLKAWHINGKIWLTGQYVKGDADGTWTYITEDGRIEKKEYFQKGLLVKTEEFIKKEIK